MTISLPWQHAITCQHWFLTEPKRGHPLCNSYDSGVVPHQSCNHSSAIPYQFVVCYRAPDQCMSLVGYDRPPLQAPSIYIPYKDAVTCRNRAWTGPLPIAAGRFWHDSDTLRHIYTGCRRCRAKKCHIWWWSTQGWCLLIFGSRVQTHMNRRQVCHT